MTCQRRSDNIYLHMECDDLHNVTYGSRIDKPYTNQHIEETAIIARGIGFKLPMVPSLLAVRTAAIGEK